MSTIPRTTQPLDAEVILPDATLSTESALYKEWQDTFVSSNPLEAQVAFFKSLAIQIRNEEIGLEFYLYWYNKVKASHPVVIANLPTSTVPEYQDINESIGTLYFAESNNANVSINALAGTTIKPYPTNLESLLPSGISSLLFSGYTKVNTLYATNIANIQTDPSALPTAAHGISLVKDTIAITRNSTSKPLVKSELEDKYGVVLDLTEIENLIAGDIALVSGEHATDIEGTQVTVDDLGNKLDPTKSTLTIDSLVAE